jgi:hypothetical protein
VSSLYHLRETEIEPSLATKLWPFINAYRPHEKPQNWRQLREEGLEQIEPESFYDILETHYFELHGCYPEDRKVTMSEENL